MSASPHVDFESKVLPSIALVESNKNSIKQDQNQSTSFGSGFFVKENGLLLTAFHVVKNASEVIIHHDNQKYSAHLLNSWAQHDVALLKVDGDSFPFLQFSPLCKTRLGQKVSICGFPFSISYTFNTGSIAAILTKSTDFLSKKLLLDVYISPGHSGSPVIDSQGTVIAICTHVMKSKSEYRGYGVASPINILTNIAELLHFH
ncbi:MAG: serine protease [Rhabdochlamydiaceae bacterium]|nr:serine protease [Candidatus Amphrikana amoebophyrae]